MTKRYVHPYINLRYRRTRTRLGAVTTSAVSQGIYYCSYGNAKRNPDKLSRGEWYTPQGEVSDYAHVKAWGINNAHRHKLAYQFVISMKEGELHPQDYVAAMNVAAEETDLFKEYRLITHEDSDHSHAHVLAFRDKKLTKKQLEAWKDAAREPLLDIEQKRLAEAETARERMVAAQAGVDFGWE